MTAVKKILGFQIYPNIYSNLCDLFPELGFIKITKGYQATLKAINLISKSAIKVYVATLPKVIKDAKQLICENSIKNFKEVIKDSQSYFTYLPGHITATYVDILITVLHGDKRNARS